MNRETKNKGCPTNQSAQPLSHQSTRELINILYHLPSGNSRMERKNDMCEMITFEKKRKVRADSTIQIKSNSRKEYKRAIIATIKKMQDIDALEKLYDVIPYLYEQFG